jgi:hypothetical protein
MSATYYKTVLKAIFYSWATLVCLSICTELESTYRSTRAAHMEALHEYEDCHTSTHYFKYPIKCARVLSVPPSSFLSSWLSVAFTNVRWCGTSKCEVLFTWRGILTFIFAVILTGPRVRGLAQSTIQTLQAGMHERRVAKLVD